MNKTINNIHNSIAIICIGRLENRYAIEFVEYYKKLGFDKIFIIDNNYDDEEYFEDVLQQYIDEDFVKIIDYRNKKSTYDHPSIQADIYNELYRIYCNEYDYLMFIDFDEYLCLTKNANIKEYLNRNTEYDCILLNWMMMSDNNLITYDGRKCLERFTEPIDYNKCISFDNIPENNHVKSIIRCQKNDMIYFTNPHIPDFRYLDDSFKFCNNKFEYINKNDLKLQMFLKYDYTLSYIKHFSTKTIEEYINVKLKRGVPDRPKYMLKYKYNIDLFFKINKKTEEKLLYLNKNIDKYERYSYYNK